MPVSVKYKRNAETDLPTTPTGILRSFDLYKKLCDEGRLTLDSVLSRNQVHTLLEDGIYLVNGPGERTQTLAEIILEQVEGFEANSGEDFQDGVLGNYGWSRDGLIEKFLSKTDYTVEDSTDDFQIYMRSIPHSRSIPHQVIYSKRGQFALGRKMRQGDMEARDKLIKSHLRFVARIALSFHYKFGGGIMDYIEWGNELLVEKADHYDPDQDATFTTYIGEVIRKELHNRRFQYRRNKNYKQSSFYPVAKVKAAINKYFAEHGVEPDEEEVIHLVDLKETVARRAYLMHKMRKTPSVNAADIDKRHAEYGEMRMNREDSYDPGISTAPKGLRRAMAHEKKEAIDKMLFMVIGKKYTRVLKMHAVDKMTMRQIAAVEGVSYQSIKNWIDDAKRKLTSDPRAVAVAIQFMDETRSA